MDVLCEVKGCQRKAEARGGMHDSLPSCFSFPSSANGCLRSLTRLIASFLLTELCSRIDDRYFPLPIIIDELPCVSRHPDKGLYIRIGM